MKATARAAHEIPERAPIQIAPGDAVTALRRDTTWPEFVYIVTDDGEGWVPARHLSGDSGPVTVRVAYDTIELAVTVGMEVTVLERDDVSGWWWCRTAAEDEGWVPATVFSEGPDPAPT
jgi:hypothetical protein